MEPHGKQNGGKWKECATGKPEGTPEMRTIS